MSKKWPLSADEFKAIYSKVPRICVDLVIQTEDGILMTERTLDSWKGMWHIPGGTIYYKEKISDAVQRVAKDELNISVTVQKLLGYMEYFSEERERGFGYTISMVFLCSIKDGTPQGGEQGEKIGYFKDIPENIIAEQKAFLQNYLK